MSNSKNNKERLGKEWHEIYTDSILVAQIDMGVPLAAITEDMSCYHKGEESTSGEDYAVCGEGEIFDELIEKVYHDQESN